MNKQVVYLTVILIMASILRLGGLERFSPPLNRDEAGIGYNAYSLLLTGKDEHGVAWPLSFKSIGDYKMPGYIYLSMLPVSLFGLEVSSVRLWSATAGILAVAGLYCVSLILYQHLGIDKKTARYAALLPSALLAINPWHLHYSRLGFEANVNLTLFIWSMWFLLRSIKDVRFLIGACLLWVLMQFMYSSTFIFLPVLLLGFLLISGRYKVHLPLQRKSYLIVAGIFFAVGSLVALQGVWHVSSAKQSITIFSDPYLVDTLNTKRGQLQAVNPIAAKLLYNKLSYFSPILVKNYISHYTPGFLFLNAIHHPWHGIYGQGFFYLLDGIFFVIGLFFLLNKFQAKYRFPVLGVVWWLLASPAASMITVDAPHATRSLYLLPVILVVTGLGLLWSVEVLSNKIPSLKPLVIGFITVLYLLSLCKAGYQYLVVYPRYQDKALFGGVKEAVRYAESIRGERDVFMPDVSASSYLYHLYFNKVDPSQVFLAQWKGVDTAGLSHIEKVGKWHFISDLSDVPNNSVVISRTQDSQASSLKLLRQFNNPQTGIIEWGVYEN